MTRPATKPRPAEDITLTQDDLGPDSCAVCGKFAQYLQYAVGKKPRRVCGRPACNAYAKKTPKKPRPAKPRRSAWAATEKWERDMLLIHLADEAAHWTKVPVRVRARAYRAAIQELRRAARGGGK